MATRHNAGSLQVVLAPDPHVTPSRKRVWSNPGGVGHVPQLRNIDVTTQIPQPRVYVTASRDNRTT